jgi:hypothetical protein
MTITIPIWLLWTLGLLGVSLLVFFVICAYIGFLLITDGGFRL